MIDTEISLYKESDFIFIKKDDVYIKLGESRYRKIIDFEIYEIQGDKNTLITLFQYFLQVYEPKRVSAQVNYQDSFYIDILNTLSFKQMNRDSNNLIYVYLKEDCTYGYIYLVTDKYNNKQYIGQHVADKFDKNYFGSGKLINRIKKQRKESLQIEILEWCRLDISDREIYYINKYNTLHPNGYNLTVRKQGEWVSSSINISERQKKWAKTAEGIEFYKNNSKRIKEYYASEKGKLTIAKNIQHYKEFFNTEEGKRVKEQKIKKYIDFCHSEAGKEMCAKRREKQKAYNKTKEGKIKEKRRIQAVRDFYKTPEGKLAKKKQVERYIENKIKKVNAMSEEEWQLYLIQHPTTILRKYRNKK